MTRERQNQILSEISRLSDELEQLKLTQSEIVRSGSASASLSAGSGSKSYTRLDLKAIQDLIREKTRQLNRLRARLAGSSGIRSVMFAR